MEAQRLDTLPCGVAVVGADGRVQHASAGLGRLVGEPAAALRGRSFDSLLAPAAAVLYQSYLLPLLHLHGHVEEFELALRHAAGQRTSVLYYGTRRPATDGASGAVDVVLVPVRERRRIEEEMLRVKRAAELAPGMMFQLVHPPQGRLVFTYVSDAVRSLYGITAEAAAHSAEAVWACLHPDDAVRLRQHLRPGGPLQSWRLVVRAQRPRVVPGAADGARAPAWHEVQATPQRRSDGTWVWHGFVADVTQREIQAQHHAEREAAERHARERSAFLARVSHEFRTPLNAIIGFSQLLARPQQAGLGPEQARQLATIQAAGNSLLNLVNDVLELTALDSGQTTLCLEPLALQPLLQQALDLVTPQAAAAGVTLQPLRCETALQVQADRQRLGQVLANLLSNAVKYNRPQGQVVLRAQAREGGVSIEVQDTGPGIGLQQRAKLFQPFNRLGQEHGGPPGTGLGLVITRNLVTGMGGRLQVDSVPGTGSVFSVWLPAVVAAVAGQGGGPDAGFLPPDPAPTQETAGPQAAKSAAVSRAAIEPTAPPSAPPPAPSAPPPAAHEVLYVEDDEVNRVLMQAILALRPGLRLRMAATGAQATTLALAQPPDLLLVDLHLPDTDGFALVEHLRTHATLYRVPVVLVSAAVGPEERSRATALGLVDCWSKPLDLGRTLAALDTLLPR
jgi:signal transduction histidine kinase/CheY-like chemotaxis protein